MLTQREFNASIAVLRALRAPACASVVLSWDADMQRALVGLSRMGYVANLSPARDGAFRWDRIGATEMGLTYLSQIERAQEGN